MKAYPFIRSVEFNHFFEVFVVSAIATIIGIRFYLQLTGFPQLATGDVHIAHMLWGGLLLTVSLLGLLTFINNDLKLIWAAVGGAGFGTFIDEIGKFVTKDNDYFFQPTFALIYVIFVFLYCFFKLVLARKIFSKQEYLVNSIEELKEAVTNELDSEEIDRAISYLKKSDKNNEMTLFLTQTFQKLKALPHQKPNLYTKIKNQSTLMYKKIISYSWFVHFLSAFFIYRTLEYIIRGGDLIFQLTQTPFVEIVERVLQLRGILPILYVTAVLLQALFTFIGVWKMKTSRKTGYMYFKYAILISLFVLQVFGFYRSPVIAFFSTVRDVALFTLLDYFISKEKQLKNTKELKIKDSKH